MIGLQNVGKLVNFEGYSQQFIICDIKNILIVVSVNFGIVLSRFTLVIDTFFTGLRLVFCHINL